MNKYEFNQMMNWVWVIILSLTIYGCTIYILGDVDIVKEITGVEITSEEKQ